VPRKWPRLLNQGATHRQKRIKGSSSTQAGRTFVNQIAFSLWIETELFDQIIARRHGRRRIDLLTHIALRKLARKASAYSENRGFTAEFGGRPGGPAGADRIKTLFSA
jgi:hypothetical protein